MDFEAQVKLLEKMGEDFLLLATSDFPVPTSFTYTVLDHPQTEEKIQRRATSLELLQKLTPLRKVAFDTRRMDPNERNPRVNAQFFVRAEPYVSTSDEKKLNIFSKLLNPIKEIKNQFAKEPEYHSSYVRLLDEILVNLFKVKDGEIDVFGPQLEYLEQILFLRYRLTMADIEVMSDANLKTRILSKDEKLLKRAAVVFERNKEGVKTESAKKESHTTSPEDLIKALFSPDLEEGIEKTITITIKHKKVE